MLTLWKPNTLRRRENGTAQETHAPSSPALSLFDEFDRMFDRMLQDTAFPATAWTGERGTGAGTGLSLATDITETPDEFLVRVDAPGLSPEDIDVKLEGDRLTIRAERKAANREKGESFLRSECRYGVYQRSFVLPMAVDAAKVDARYEHGVLRIALPKREDARPKAITVKVS